MAFALLVTMGMGLIAGDASAAESSSEANRKFVEAVQAWQRAEALAEDPVSHARERASLLKSVVANLNGIIEEHPESDLAVQLVIGSTIGPLSLPVAEAALEEAAQYGTCSKETINENCFLVEAIRAARQIYEPEEKARQLAKIAALKRDASLFDEAIAAAYQMVETRSSELTLSNIAKKQAEAGLFKEALHTAERMTVDLYRVKLLAEIGQIKKDSDVLHEAVTQVSRMFGGIRENEHSLLQIAEAQSEAGFHPDARQTINLITDRMYRVWALVTAYEEENSLDLLLSAIHLSRQGPLDIPTVYPWHETAAARELAKEGRLDEAFAMVAAMEDQSWRETGLYVIALSLAEAGEGAEALDVIQRIEIDDEKQEALFGIVRNLSQAGRVHDARKFASYLTDAVYLDAAHAEIAKALHAAGETEEALALAREIGTPQHLADALVAIVRDHPREGLLEEALEAVEASEDARKKAEALLEVAAFTNRTDLYLRAMDIAADLDDGDRSYLLASIKADPMDDTILETLVEHAASIKSGSNKDRVLSHAALSYLARGDVDDAIEVMRTMWTASSSLGVLRAISSSREDFPEQEARIRALWYEIFTEIQQYETPLSRASNYHAIAAALSDCDVDADWCGIPG